MQYTIEIRNGKKSTKKVKDRLRENGFRFQMTGKYTGVWQKETSDEKELNKWRRFCGRKFSCRIYQKELHERGKTYREDFFREHPEEVYHCAYCGRKLKKETLVVDHLIPVQKAKTSRYWQKYLRKHCEGNVNHPNNLVGACRKCNAKKGAKTSFWVLRGKIGRHYEVWLCVKLMVTVMFALGFWILWDHFSEAQRILNLFVM